MGNLFSRNSTATAPPLVVAPNPPAKFVTREQIEKVASTGGPRTSVLFQDNQEVVVLPPTAPAPAPTPAPAVQAQPNGAAVQQVLQAQAAAAAAQQAMQAQAAAAAAQQAMQAQAAAAAVQQAMQTTSQAATTLATRPQAGGKPSKKRSARRSARRSKSGLKTSRTNSGKKNKATSRRRT